MKALRMKGWHVEPVLEHGVEPASATGDQALIRIGGAGLCHSDLHILREFDEGVMPWPVPFTLGHENAGWVRELGGAVTGLEVGQPVAVYGPWGCGRCTACSRGEENYCTGAAYGHPVGGLGADGGMADLMLVPHSRHLVPLPDGLSPADAAPLTDAALTSYSAIAGARPRLVPGTSAVVIGAGGLGHLAVQILRATTDARVVAVDRSAAALELARESGAEVCVTAGPDAVGALRDAVGRTGATAVFDMVASDETLATAAAVVGQNGWIGIVGLAGGSLPVSVLGLPFGTVVRPTYWGSLPELHEVLALAARGDVRARVTTYPLSAATQAVEDLAAGRIAGRAVVVPDDPIVDAD